MRQRKIGKSITLQTIQDPDSIEIDPQKGKMLIKKFGRKILKVPVVEKGNDIIVKSVFYKK